MQPAGSQRFVAAVAAVALFGSGGAQALLHRCGSGVATKSCCCEKADRPASPPTRVQASDHACCSVTSSPTRQEDATPQATLSPTAPVVVSVAFAVLPAAPPDGVASPLGPQHARSAGPPILRTTCSLLI